VAKITMSELPEKIGKYKIVQQVGRGSMGTVYSAHDPFSDRLVAIKLAHPQFVDQSEEGQRFRKLFFNEAHAAGALDHPNLVKVLDADVDGELCYLVMEFVEGAQTLDHYVRPDRLLSLREVVGIIYKCAKALDHAHRRGVIHRDIKPSNLLLNDERDVKIADFSIAMINRSDNLHTQFTGFLGSPLYMSPEQINELPLGSATDIFSLGTVMYQMLTGNHPFKADNLNAINKRITTEEPPALTTYRNDLPDGLSYTLRRMLRKTASQRYQSGLDLAADLAVIFEDLDAVPDEDALREKFGAIKNLGFFKGFSDADIWELIRACSWQNYPSGTAVIKEGESDHSFYIMLSGVVGIEKNGHSVDSLQAGESFGEMGYLLRAKRTATVIAKTDVSLMKVNASTIDRAAESTQLRFHKVFVRTLIARLADTTSLLARANQV
jgi:serine/threonine protein kinase